MTPMSATPAASPTRVFHTRPSLPSTPATVGTPAPPPPAWVVRTQQALAQVVTFPPLHPKLLARPPFTYVHDLLSNIRLRSTLFDEKDESDATGVADAPEPALLPASLWQVQTLASKEARVDFLQRAIRFTEERLGIVAGVNAVNVVEGRSCETTGAWLHAIATMAAERMRPPPPGRASAAPSVASTPQRIRHEAWNTAAVAGSPFTPFRQHALSSLRSSPNGAGAAAHSLSTPAKAPANQMHQPDAQLHTPDQTQSEALMTHSHTSTPSSASDPAPAAPLLPVASEPDPAPSAPAQPHTHALSPVAEASVTASQEEAKAVSPELSPAASDTAPPVPAFSFAQALDAAAAHADPRQPAPRSPSPVLASEAADATSAPDTSVIARQSRRLLGLVLPAAQLAPQHLSVLSPSFALMHALWLALAEQTGFGEHVLEGSQLDGQQLEGDAAAQHRVVASWLRYAGLAAGRALPWAPSQLIDGQHAVDAHRFVQRLVVLALDLHVRPSDVLQRYREGEEPAPATGDEDGHGEIDHQL